MWWGWKPSQNIWSGWRIGLTRFAVETNKTQMSKENTLASSSVTGWWHHADNCIFMYIFYIIMYIYNYVYIYNYTYTLYIHTCPLVIKRGKWKSLILLEVWMGKSPWDFPASHIWLPDESNCALEGEVLPEKPWIILDMSIGLPQATDWLLLV